MPSREQVRQLLDAGLDYVEAGRRLGIPAGQAYLVATGQPADGGDSTSPEQRQRGRLMAASQRLTNPPHENPTTSDSVRKWIAARVAADAQMRAAAARRTAEPPPIAEADKAQDAVTVLGRDHNQVKYLLKQLQALPSHKTGGSAEHMSRRKSIVDMITVRLSEHESVEEEYLWPAVRKALSDGDICAQTALHQEQEGKDTLTALGKLAPDTDEFDEHVERLVLQLRRHVAYEDQVFLRLREAIPADALNELGRRILAAKQGAPTRPHRHAPKKPAAAVKAAGAAAATLDKARDTVGDRSAKRKGKARSDRLAPESEGDV